MREHFIGSVLLFSGSFAPTGWLPCDGRSLPIRGHEALYTIIGNTYGGDGRTNFNLPNLNSKTATSQDHHNFMVFIICINGDFPTRP